MTEQEICQIVKKLIWSIMFWKVENCDSQNITDFYLKEKTHLRLKNNFPSYSIEMTENKLEEFEVENGCIYAIKSRRQRLENIHLISKDYKVMNFIAIPVGSVVFSRKDDKEVYLHFVMINSSFTLIINQTDIVSIKKIDI